MRPAGLGIADTLSHCRPLKTREGTGRKEWQLRNMKVSRGRRSISSSQADDMYLEKFDLSGRTAVVTGGGRNIGLACAHALAEAGATVIITGRRQSETSRQGQSVLASRGYHVDVVQFDVRSSEEVDEAAAAVRQKYGRVDILVCNSGRGRGGIAGESVTDSLWEEMIDINLTGVFRCCRAFGAQMLDAKMGSIITIGSISGTIVNRPQPQSYYNAAKAGVHHLSRSLAAEWAARGIRVNCVAPTYVDNGPDRYGRNDETMFPVWMSMTPIGRQARWDEVASTVLFLASDAGSMITGQVIHVDGGYTLW
jgi:NAD(P)-dependent dehydrogenase (short-subunit alcohol dehydrogenase family)